MKKVTKVISVFCIFALLFALAACGNDVVTPEPTGEGVINGNPIETNVPNTPVETTEPTAHTDEAEGAIVAWDRDRWECYGLPIYDPYANAD